MTISLDERAFSYFNVATGRWEIEPGTYEVRVGASSEDIRLISEVELAGTDAPNPYEDIDVAPYETADVTDVSDAHFAALLGRPVPDAIPQIGPNMCFRDLNHGRSAILWLVWLVLRSRVRAMEKRGVSDINVLFIWNMPLRAMGIMTGGITDMGVVDAVLREVRGFGWGGAVLLVLALALGWGPLAGCLLWLAWILTPILGALVANLVRNAALARKLAGKR